MVLEATIIIVDNSEHSRNGDYLPSRFEAQSDTVNLIFSAKTQANPESSVGLMSMGGSQPEVLTTLTTDFGKVIDGLHRTKIKGSSHLSTALNVAQLALKHRQNKSQHQRIIVFTCSPLSEDEKTVVNLAKRMKKNAIAVDIIAFGDLDADTVKKVEAFHEKIKGGDGSHLAIIPPGPHLLSDSVLSSPILAGEAHGVPTGDADMGSGATGGGGGGGGGGDGFDLGFDPASDPELALALRMSMEEEQRRQARDEEERKKTEGKTELEAVPEEGGSSAAAAEKKDDAADDKKDKKPDGDGMDTS